MTSGSTVQSRRNWMWREGGQSTVYLAMIGRRIGLSLRKSDHIVTTLNLAGARSSHFVRMCSGVPGVVSRWQLGRLQDPEESPDHYLDSHQVLYLPVNILAWTLAFSIS